MDISITTQETVAGAEESAIVEEPADVQDIDAMIQSQIADEMARESIEGAPSNITSTTREWSIEANKIDHSEHAEQCRGSPGASTPPASPQPSNTRGSNDVTASPIAAEIPVEMREHNALHAKALSLRPLMPPNRYCIGILNPAKLPKNVRKEEDFLWMKGHGVCIAVSAICHHIPCSAFIVKTAPFARMRCLLPEAMTMVLTTLQGITVSTVWNQYRQQTGIVDEFDLVIQGFTPKMDMVMRELDFQDDKHVIFRAVRTIKIDD